MALNQMIAQGAQFNMPDPVAQYAKMQQLQTAQNQNALAQYQLGSARRGDMQQNALNQAYSQGIDPATGKLDYNRVSAALAAAGAGSQIPAAMKQQLDNQRAEAELSKTTGEVRGQQQKEIDSIARALSQDPTDENILASQDIIKKSAFYDPETKTKALAAFARALKIPLEQRGSYFGMQGATAGERATANRPVAVGGSLMSPTGGLIATAPAGPIKPPEKLEVMKALGYSMDAAGDAAYEAAKRAPPAAAAVPADVATMQALGIPATSEGYTYFQALKAKDEKPTDLVRNYEYAKKQGFKGDLFAYEKSLKEAGRAPAAPRPEQPLEKVIDPVTGKIRFATRTEALGMTPASSENKPMTDLQKQAFKKDFANDTSKIKSAVTTADELEKLTDELIGNPDKKIPPHPGLGGITGYSALLPSLPSGEAAKAEQKLETFKGKIKALGRAIASQEGKLGNMAVQEWQMVSDAVQAINPRAGNLDVQMKDVVRQARDLARNMKDKFDLTYEDTTPAASPGRPAAPARTQSGATTSNW